MSSSYGGLANEIMTTAGGGGVWTQAPVPTPLPPSVKDHGQIDSSFLNSQTNGQKKTSPVWTPGNPASDAKAITQGMTNMSIQSNSSSTSTSSSSSSSSSSTGQPRFIPSGSVQPKAPVKSNQGGVPLESPIAPSPAEGLMFPGPFADVNRRLTDNGEIYLLLRAMVNEHNARVLDMVGKNLKDAVFVNAILDPKEDWHGPMACESWTDVVATFQKAIEMARAREEFSQKSTVGKIGAGIASVVPFAGALGNLTAGALGNITGGVFTSTKPTLTAAEQKDYVKRVLHRCPQLLAIVMSISPEGVGTYAVCAFNPHEQSFTIVDPFQRGEGSKKNECYINMQGKLKKMLVDAFSTDGKAPRRIRLQLYLLCILPGSIDPSIASRRRHLGASHCPKAADPQL